MKAKYVFVLSALLFTASLPGFSQAAWHQPESARWGMRQSNSSASQQIGRISNMMTVASMVSGSNPDWAKQEAENAEAQVKQTAGQGNNKDMTKALQEMLASIIAFLKDLQQAKAEQMQNINR